MSVCAALSSDVWLLICASCEEQGIDHALTLANISSNLDALNGDAAEDSDVARRRKVSPDQRVLIPAVSVAPPVDALEFLALLALDASPNRLTPQERRSQFRIVRATPSPPPEARESDASA